MNANIQPDNWYAENHTAELDAALDSFDKAINEAFGDEVVYIKHNLWDSRTSFTTVKLADHSYTDFTDYNNIGFTVTPKGVSASGYMASIKQLRRAFDALGIELPYFMSREAC